MLFQVQLANFLIPGPLCYFSQTDSIMVANSNLEIESYKFTSLQTQGKNNIDQQKQAQQKDDKAEKATPDWVVNLGENPYHMIVHNNRHSRKQDLVVTCDQSMFILTEKGKIRYQRRLEYTPSCISTYHLGKFGTSDIYEDEDRNASDVIDEAGSSLDTPCFMTILGSFKSYLMIYKDVRLIWTAKTANIPIYVSRANF